MGFSKRTLILWFVLVVLFVAFYKIFAGPTPADAPATSEGGSGFPFGGMAIGIVIIAVVYVRARRGIAIINEGVALRTKERNVEALARFEQALPRMKSNPLIHYNLGGVNLSLWRLAKAGEHMARARKSKFRSGNLHLLVSPSQALIAALEGRLDVARKFLAEAKDLHVDDSAIGLLAQAVIHCREGDFTSAGSLLERGELRALGGIPRGTADALRAWCDQEVHGVHRPVDAIAVYGEVGPDVVREVWPEFAAFVEASSRSNSDSRLTA